MTVFGKQQGRSGTAGKSLEVVERNEGNENAVRILHAESGIIGEVNASEGFYIDQSEPACSFCG